MRFKKLRLVVGISLTIFIVLVANILAFGLSKQPDTVMGKNILLKVSEIPYETKKEEPQLQVVTNQATTSVSTNKETTATNSNAVSNSQTTQTANQQPTVVHKKVKTRAS